MRVFLSYASERRAVAEPIAFALRGRGNEVFFDRSDLPPGGNYDAQIEEAVRRSDLMIFLISPESVSSERFTLTELAFARKKWRSARGRVFPVMIAPTAPQQIPAFLTSVQIMQPEGNAAAEIASFVDGLTPVAQPQIILPLALAMGIVSGAISMLKISYPLSDEALAELPSIVKNVIFVIFPPRVLDAGSWQAAYAFAPVLAILLWAWDKTRLLRALWVLPITIAAWAAAFWLSFFIVGSFQQTNYVGIDAPIADQCRERPRPSPSQETNCVAIDKYRQEILPLIRRLNWLVYTVAGMCGGFVGSLITILGLGRLSVRLRPLEAVVLVIFVGTVLGFLLNRRFFMELGIHEAQGLLFIAWQACVAAAIGWQFTKAQRW